MTELRVPSPPKITLWHAPDCSASRRARELLELTDCELELVEPIDHPPTVEQLRELAGWLGRGPEHLARTKEPAWAALGLAEAPAEAILQALGQHPELIQRPIAFAAEHGEAVVGRPPELVLRLLIPKLPAGQSPELLLRQALQGRLPK